MTRGDRRIWICWERHRRTREICRALQLPLFEFTSAAPLPIRYAMLLSRTLTLLIRERPAVLFIQCPSVVLGAWAVLLRWAFGYRVVADLHNAAVRVSDTRVPLHAALLRWLHRAADLNIVSNESLRRVLAAEGAEVLVLPDRVPEVPPGPRTSDAAGVTIVFVCSFATDEPYAALLQSAALLPVTWTVYVTGDCGRADRRTIDQLPANVRLTGFLPHADYDALLARADAVVDLTTRDDCLVCGAYEAVAFERPLVTSDTAALRAYFSHGTVYATHRPAELAAAMTRAVADRARLSAEMGDLKARLSVDWTRRAAHLRSWIATLERATG